MTRPKLTADDLWRLAEHASGYYDVDLQLHIVQPKGKPLALRLRRKSNGGTDYVADIHAPSGGRKMASPEAIDVTPPPGASKPDVPVKDPDTDDPERQAYDSLFWTRSSVEKFLLPYYSRRPREYAELVAASKDPSVYLLGHRKPTIYSILKDDDGPEGPPDPFGTIGVFLKDEKAAIPLAEYSRRRKLTDT